MFSFYYENYNMSTNLLFNNSYVIYTRKLLVDWKQFNYFYIQLKFEKRPKNVLKQQ